MSLNKRIIENTIFDLTADERSRLDYYTSYDSISQEYHVRTFSADRINFKAGTTGRNSEIALRDIEESMAEAGFKQGKVIALGKGYLDSSFLLKTVLGITADNDSLKKFGYSPYKSTSIAHYESSSFNNRIRRTFRRRKYNSKRRTYKRISSKRC